MQGKGTARQGKARRGNETHAGKQMTRHAKKIIKNERNTTNNETAKGIRKGQRRRKRKQGRGNAHTQTRNGTESTAKRSNDQTNELSGHEMERIGQKGPHKQRQIMGTSMHNNNGTCNQRARAREHTQSRKQWLRAKSKA